MTKQSAVKLKVQLPVKDDVTESEREVKCEYLNGKEDSSIVILCGSSESETKQSSDSSASSSDTCDWEEKSRIRRTFRTKELCNGDYSDKEDSDEKSELEETTLQHMDGLIKTEETEDGVCYNEPLDQDTDSDDDGWPMLLQEERDAEKNQKKKDEIVDESDKESEEEWLDDESRHQEEEEERVVLQGDISQARFVLRNITSRIPLIEETAIRRGVKLSGPPLEFATTHLDEYARKFRWPQHVRNLRNTNFSQDPTEILEDFELLTTAKQSESELPVSSFLLKQTERDVSQDSAFAQVPRPMVALAAGTLRRSLRKRKRTTQEVAFSELPSAHTLLNVARVGGQFGDHFVESLLSSNGKALQGIDDEYCNDIDKRCWSSLPTKKKPIANWRFVLEHVRRTMGSSTGSSDAVYPPMKQQTIERITHRLKKLHGCTTQHEENDILERGTPSKEMEERPL
ncbi:unnamed protein product [Peronospora farinosa]|uniref:Rrn9 domain-containing protein n=2 Tax=Peronospora farinosa TaxID=134698 RepID=A0AAV0ULF6_9STRA|nr:unnamed protein product [Peronospora farinosa]CAI5736420.1 unnamed protein product [Peronospora farinosa]